MDIYKRLLQYTQRYKGRLALAIVCMLGFSIANAMVSATLYLVINGLHNKDYVVMNNIPHLPFIEGVIKFPTWWIPIIMVAVFTLRGFFDYISNYEMSSIGIRAVRQVRDDLYKHLVNLSHDFFSRGRTGDFLSRILNDVGSIQGAITDVIVDLVKQPLVILFNIPMVFIWGGPAAIYALIIFPVVAVPIVLLGKNLRRTTKKMQERSADITAFIGETLTGINVVKAFNQEENEISKFERINKSVFDFFKKTIRITIVQRPLIEIMGAVGAAIAVWFGIKTLPPDRFVAFVGSLFIFYEPLKKISKVNSTIQQSIAAGGRIFEILDARPSIQDLPGAVCFQGPVQTISFEHINFSYEPQNPVLHDIHFQVRHGEMVAIVGVSGSGKSTLVNLLPRFYDPISGAVKINGMDIRGLTLKSLRDLIGIVSQDTVLFHSTVRENIAYGKPNATMEEIKAAAEAAYAVDFIELLPNGYDTSLGERGLKLSGGQRQRLAIARAFLKNPPIFILDEATSHLDTESEREVQAAIENLIKGRTVFVIAHRLSTIQRADRILVLEEGRLIQQGTNQSLLKEGGAYKRLHDLQFNL
ncbi:MAG: ABC transporter ATP-binding protein [Candidatus Omnitrophica bacterium]|nr:ABC transporter ATP-binding protein [Candidatus Omnitrophota bacterium]